MVLETWETMNSTAMPPKWTRNNVVTRAALRRSDDRRKLMARAPATERSWPDGETRERREDQMAFWKLSLASSSRRRVNRV